MHTRKPLSSLNGLPKFGSTTLAILAVLSPLAALAQSSRHAAKVNLTPLLGKPVADYEKALGKPFKKTEAGKSWWFKAAGFKQIICTQTKYNSDHLYVSYITAMFPKGSIKDWKIALAKVGVASAGVVTSQSEKYLTMESKNGGWTGYWLPNNADTNCDRLEIGPKPR